MGTWVCDECAAKILLIRRQRCFICGALSEKGRTCARCRQKTYLDGLVVVTYFDRGPIREMIHALKYQNTKELVDILGRLGVCGLEHVYQFKEEDVKVVAVPLHPKRLAKRGYNQAQLLAMKLGLDVGGVLKRVKNTQSQTGLSRFARERNIEGAFVCEDPIDGEVLLVDDVATTGATMNECALVLKAAGASRVWGLVIARG